MKESFIAKVTEVAAKKRANPYWEMILAVAGDERAIENIYKGLSVEELSIGSQSEFSIAPSVIEERIIALTAIRPQFLRELRSSLETVDSTENFLEYARVALRRSLFPILVDPKLEEWSWEEESVKRHWYCYELAQRPMRAHRVTTDELISVTELGGGILYALRGQDADLSGIDYNYWLDNIGAISPYVLTFIIGFSLRGKVTIDEWREAYLPLLTPDRDPRELIPAIYKLLKPEWNVALS